MPHSLRHRLLSSIAIPLVLFFGLTIVGLDAIFRDLARRSLEELLNGQLIALISAAEFDEQGGVSVTQRGAEARLETPGSGLYAEIRTAGGALIWRSASMAGTFLNFGRPLAPGQKRIAYQRLAGDRRVAVASRGILWEDDARKAALVFSVASTLESYDEQLWRFRTQLFGWFTVLTLALLVTLALLLRWVLTPVQRLESEIAAVEAGTREQLGAGYPRELAGVAGNLNALLTGERRRVARYRDTLGNLAHSLKTPLAVMRSLIGAAGERAGAIDAQIDRMSAIIERQLKRAALSGGALLGAAPVEVAPVAAELRATLIKVYARKDLVIELLVAPGAQFLGDRADFTEILGNLLDNACKWCAGRVRLLAGSAPTGAVRGRLQIEVEDDGPGIPQQALARIGERGVRADESTPGHGLGLAMVRETVELYGGSVELGRSELGGARVALTLPGRSGSPAQAAARGSS
ncbi:MAG TPA: ATP-binding protein [Steroidobacteraceae bacterium]